LPGGNHSLGGGGTVGSVVGSSLLPGITTSFTSFPNGVNDPGALQVEFDFFTGTGAVLADTSTITIYGVALSDLQQAANYSGMQIIIRGGMQAGLPLANPAQNGIILQGLVQQGFGNWRGTDERLDLLVNGSIWTNNNPGNFSLNWPKNTSLANALQLALTTAYPGAPPPTIAIGSQYVQSHDELHVCVTLQQLKQVVHSITKAISPPGVSISVLPSGGLLAYDGSQQNGPIIRLDFTDLIGQPTWIASDTMQFTTVMRADIANSSLVVMPLGLPSGPGTTGIAVQPGNAAAALKYSTAFQGVFLVNGVRQIGNFRDPNGESWATVFQAVPQSKIQAPPIF
jgi:hypothetical protein